MYDKNGVRVVGYYDNELRDVFGTLSSRKRKNHHRRYLRRIDKSKLYSVIDRAFQNDKLFQQYQNNVSNHYAVRMKGRFIMFFFQSMLLYMEKPHQQQHTIDGLVKSQILSMRRILAFKMSNLNHFGYTKEKPIYGGFPNKVLTKMSEIITNGFLTEVTKVYPEFMKAREVDKHIISHAEDFKPSTPNP